MRVCADQIGEHSEQHASTDREDQGERQRKAGRRRRVEPRVRNGAQRSDVSRPPSPTLRAVSSVGAGGVRCDPGITPDHDSDYKADCQGEHE